LARAKTEELVGKGMVLDSLKKVHILFILSLYFKNSDYIFPLYFTPSCIISLITRLAIKKKIYNTVVCKTLPLLNPVESSALSARFIRIKLVPTDLPFDKFSRLSCYIGMWYVHVHM